MAGVLYSVDFNGDPYNVINYTIGHPSNYLLVNQEQGNISKIGKYHDDPYGYFERLKFSDIRPDNPNRVHMSDGKGSYKLLIKTIFQHKWENIFRLAALANHMESDLGHPVDVEFALEPNGVINILQQRPYIINPDYIVQHTKNDDWIGYNRHSPIIRGEVKIVDNVKTFAELDRATKHSTWAGKILLSKEPEHNNSFQILTMYDYATKSNTFRTVLHIDAGHRIHHELYGHFGNEWRERGTPFLSTKRASDFANVHDGDIMEMDMRTTQFKILPQKTR